jgi:hypothetical protein
MRCGPSRRADRDHPPRRPRPRAPHSGAGLALGRAHRAGRRHAELSEPPPRLRHLRNGACGDGRRHPEFSDVRSWARPPDWSDEAIISTILITDIVGSTQMVERLGDSVWRELLAEHHDDVRRVLERFGGSEVNTTGDGVLATFPTPGVPCGRDSPCATRVSGAAYPSAPGCTPVRWHAPRTTSAGSRSESRPASWRSPNPTRSSCQG